MVRTLENTRFGSIEFGPSDVLHFPDGLIGFPNLTNFVYVVHRPGSTFHWLQSLEEPSIAFLVTDPGHYIEDYGVEIGSEDSLALQLGEAPNVLILVTASLTKGESNSLNLNLAGPIVINMDYQVGRQLVVEGEYEGRVGTFGLQKAA